MAFLQRCVVFNYPSLVDAGRALALHRRNVKLSELTRLFRKLRG